jgi:hypothetical protein
VNLWQEKESELKIIKLYLCLKVLKFMAKGPEKNTKNKALHTKLLNRKKAKLQEEKREKALRLKALVAKMNQQKNNGESKTE